MNNGDGQPWGTRTVGAPANSDASLKSNATKNLLASTLINPKDPQDMGVATGQDPVRIHAGNNLVFDGVTLNVAKSSLISANGNIEDLNYVGQHQLSTDVTRIVAGGDLRGQENRPGTRDFGIKMRKNSLGDLHSADHDVFLGQKTPHTANVRRHRRRRRNIAAANVLSQIMADRRENFTIVEPVHNFI